MKVSAIGLIGIGSKNRYRLGSNHSVERSKHSVSAQRCHKSLRRIFHRTWWRLNSISVFVCFSLIIDRFGPIIIVNRRSYFSVFVDHKRSSFSYSANRPFWLIHGVKYCRKSYVLSYFVGPTVFVLILICQASFLLRCCVRFIPRYKSEFCVLFSSTTFWVRIHTLFAKNDNSSIIRAQKIKGSQIMVMKIFVFECP